MLFLLHLREYCHGGGSSHGCKPSDIYKAQKRMEKKIPYQMARNVWTYNTITPTILRLIFYFTSKKQCDSAFVFGNAFEMMFSQLPRRTCLLFEAVPLTRATAHEDDNLLA